jgi:hypothetical protein
MGGMTTIKNINHHMSTNDVMGEHHHHSPYYGVLVFQGMGQVIVGRP